MPLDGQHGTPKIGAVPDELSQLRRDVIAARAELRQIEELLDYAERTVGALYRVQHRYRPALELVHDETSGFSGFDLYRHTRELFFRLDKARIRLAEARRARG